MKKLEKTGNKKNGEKPTTESKETIRLNALIRLISDLLVIQYKMNKNTIYKSLNEIGLSPTEIGDIFGKTRTDVGSALTKIKKSNKEEKIVKK